MVCICLSSRTYIPLSIAVLCEKFCEAMAITFWNKGAEVNQVKKKMINMINETTQWKKKQHNN